MTTAKRIRLVVIGNFETVQARAAAQGITVVADPKRPHVKHSTSVYVAKGDGSKARTWYATDSYVRLLEVC